MKQWLQRRLQRVPETWNQRVSRYSNLATGNAGEDIIPDHLSSILRGDQLVHLLEKALGQGVGSL